MKKTKTFINTKNQENPKKDKSSSKITKPQKSKTLIDKYEDSILKTLAYRAYFRSALSYHQLLTHLIDFKEENLDNQTFKKALQNLVEKEQIKFKKNKYFHYSVKSPFSWKSRVNNSQKHLESNGFVFKILGKIPWIVLLCVTGSVAAHNSTKKDDVDVFIVTKKNRLWLTRFFVVLSLKAMNKYRTDDNFEGKICPNLYLSEDSLEWDKEKQNLYVANEIALMHPVINRENTYFKFLSENKWIKDHLAHFNFHFEGKKTNLEVDLDLNTAVDFLENGFRRIQQYYMNKKKTSEDVSNKKIHFNKNDSTKGILRSFKNLHK